MIVEVIAVGTELLLGQIENSNASHIGRRLAEEGLDCHYQMVVGDNLGRLTTAISTALERADAVILTGGIGPTQDDLTREAVCAVTERRMRRDEDHAAWIRQRIISAGGSPRVNQLRMADVPEGAEAMPNRTGVALGVALEHRSSLIFALPGVPAEMKPMLDEQVIPRLRARTGGLGVLMSRVIKTWGQGESAVADQLGDLFESANPSLAFLIKDMEVQVRITAKADDPVSADRLIGPVEKVVKDRLGDTVFGVDDDTVETKIIESLHDRGWTFGTVEEATAGQVAARIVTTVGSAALFRGAVIPPAGDGPIEPPTADVLLFVGQIEAEPADGLRSTRPVTMRVVTPNGTTKRTFRFGGDDERTRAFATIAGLHMLRIRIS